MKIDIVTIFPEMFAPVLSESILGRAQTSGKLSIWMHDLRNYTHDTHRTVDDRPYGGGPGMVMKPEPIFEAVEAIRKTCAVECRTNGNGSCQTLLMSPQGKSLCTGLAKDLSTRHHLIVLCGHYEGVDERIRQELADQSVSIGDYVLTGGELPAMVLIDALSRYVPGVIGHDQATQEESFSDGRLEYPQYTRPLNFRGMRVPEVLRSGDHEQILQWRKEQSRLRTQRLRPDLLENETERGS